MSRITDIRTRLKRRPFEWGLLFAGTVAAALFAVVLLLATSRQQSDLWVEAGKGLVQVIAVVVLGAALKLAADAYQQRRQNADLEDERRRQRDDQRVEFRAAIYRRLVNATNVLRKAPTLIEANRSVKTWSEQMLLVIDAGFELRVIRHEIAASASVIDPPFADEFHEPIDRGLRQMYGYVDDLARDFRAHKKRLSEKQREAESYRLRAGNRADTQAAMWDELQQLWSVADLTGTPDSPPPPAGRTFVSYQRTYEEVLDNIIRASLTESRQREPAKPDASTDAGAR
jgi:hypothetical protein